MTLAGGTNNSDYALKIINAAASSELMRVTGSGNFGIGTSSPIAPLMIGSGTGGGNFPSTSKLAFGANNSVITFLSANDSASIDGVVSAWNTVYNHENAKIVFDKPAANTGQLLFFTQNGSGIAERMRIDSSGNVGIGTNNATSKLVIGNGNASEYIDVNINGGTSSNYGPTLAFAKGGTQFGQIANFGRVQGGTSSDFFVTAVGSNALILGTGQTERMRVTSAGLVGIGTTAPFGKLSVSVVAGAPASSGNMTNGFTVHNTDGGRAIQLGINETDAYTYIQTGYVNNANVAQPLAFFTGATEKMRLTAAGNVGLGTTNPTFKLHIVGSGTDARARIESTSTANAQLSFVNTSATGGFVVGLLNDTSGDALIYHQDAKPIGFYTAGTERMRIASGGNLLVNTTDSNPGYFNTGTGTRIGSGVIVTSSTGGSIFANPTSGGGVLMSFGTGNFWNTGTISTNNSNTSYNTSSDYRLKENIAPMTGSLARVAALKPCTYTWKADGSDGEGFIAHELQEICPHAVTGVKDGVNKDGKPVYQGIDTSFLVAILTAAIQELKVELDSVKAELQTLKGN